MTPTKPGTAREQPSKPDRARELLATQRAGLDLARKVWAADKSAYGHQQLRQANKFLARIAEHEDELSRDAEFFAPLILGFQGENGFAPLIRSLIAEAQSEAERNVASIAA